MKRLQLLLSAAAVVVILTGCILTSVYPFYTENDLTFDPKLVGNWSKPSEKETWQFEREGDKSYKLTLISDNKTNVVQAHLFKLKEMSYLDFYSPDSNWEGAVPPIPAHMVLRVLEISKQLKLAAPNHDAVRQLLEKNPELTPHLMLNKEDKPENRRVVLTGTTAQLQKFLTRDLKKDEIWSDSVELERTN